LHYAWSVELSEQASFEEATVSPHIDFASRRRLLKFPAASPLFARSALAEGLRQADPADWAPRDLEKLIADPTQALDVFDFEPVMKKNVPPAH
jgi:4-hydroxymandelate oxidase